MRPSYAGDAVSRRLDLRNGFGLVTRSGVLITITRAAGAIYRDSRSPAAMWSTIASQRQTVKPAATMKRGQAAATIRTSNAGRVAAQGLRPGMK
jgi:hypothetical protein